MLPRMVYDYYAGGADGEVTLADNVAAFERRRIAYRVMAGVGVERREPMSLAVRPEPPLPGEGARDHQHPSHPTS